MAFNNKEKMKSTSKDTHLFISTTNCLISGGVETILRNGALLPQQQINTNPSNENSNAPTMASIESLISEDDFMTPISSSSNHGNSATNKPNLASTIFHSVKSSTATIESQLRGMAIRAASNETKKDDSTAALILYSLNGTSDFFEIGCTEFRPVVGNTEQYCIPVVLDDGNTNIEDTNIDRQRGYTNIDRQRGYLQVRIVIRSGAQVLGMKQSRQYVIAIGNFPLSRTPNAFSNISTNAVSNFVNEAVITMTVVPDASSPRAFRMGWSLTDPITYDVFNCNLVKPYHFNHFIGMERSIESTVTLPVCAALTELIVNAAKISANHSICKSTKLNSHFMMYKDGMAAMRKGNIDAQIQIFRFMKFSETNEFQGNIPCRIQFRSPIDIFEQELGSGEVAVYNIPVGSASNLQAPNHQPTISIPFFPPVAKFGHYKKKIGFLRFEIPYEQYSATSSNNFLLLDMEIGNGPAATSPNVGKHDAYQGYLEIDNVLDIEGGRMLNVPVFSSGQNGVQQQQIGLLTVHISARNASSPVEKTQQHQEIQEQQQLNESFAKTENEERFLYADNGLLDLIGLQHKIRATDTLDRTCAQAAAPDDSDKSNTKSQEEAIRYRQMKTMGHFLHPAWLRKHAIYRIQGVKDLEKRFDQYLNAISSNSEIPDIETNLRKGPSCFRPSTSKAEAALSGIPFNVHIQSLTVEKLANREEVAVFSNVTCGAPADHARGFTASQSSEKNNISSRPAGGLLNWEKCRDELEQKLHEAKSELIQVVGSYFQSAAVKESGKGHYVSNNTTIQNIRYKACDLEQRLTELTWEISLRRANVFSQALSIAISSFLSTFSNIVSRADCNKQTSSLIESWIRHGFLLCFEGLLSAAGKETGMIEDATVAIDMLSMAGVMLVCDQKQTDLLDFGSNATQEEESGRQIPVHGSQFIHWIKIIKQTQQPNCSASNVTIIVQVGLSSQYYSTHVPMSLRETVVPFYPTLFQMGVDIRQWGANAGANMKIQLNEQKVKLDRQLTRRDTPDEDEAPELSATETCDLLMKINLNALKTLNLYAHRTVPLSSGNTQENNPSALTSKVHPIVTSLWQYIDNAHGKMEHGVLDACAQAACKLGGGSIVFCKSGKDRTAMQVTYKQAQFIHKFICTADIDKTSVDTSEEKKQVIVSDSTLMRLYGTRLMICEKNVGQFKYAFNSLQAKFMPDVLCPPPTAMAGFLKGGRVFSKEGMIET